MFKESLPADVEALQCMQTMWLGMELGTLEFTRPDLSWSDLNNASSTEVLKKARAIWGEAGCRSSSNPLTSYARHKNNVEKADTYHDYETYEVPAWSANRVKLFPSLEQELTKRYADSSERALLHEMRIEYLLTGVSRESLTAETIEILPAALCNGVARRLRSERIGSLHFVVPEQFNFESVIDPHGEEAYDNVIEADYLRELLSLLAPGEQAVMQLRFRHHEQKEIAERLGVTLGSVKQTTFRAQKKLAPYLLKKFEK